MLCLSAYAIDVIRTRERGEPAVTHNPPPLVSPVPGLTMQAVLDQDQHLSAGLALGPADERALILIGAIPVVASGPRREFRAWADALTDVGRVAPTARIADFGYTPDGRPYLATFVPPSLADRMRRVGPPPHSIVRVIATAVADVLAAAHAVGVVHGAVSPATILIDNGRPQLGGFGALAPLLDAPLGVWAFTAPEHREAAAAGGIVGSPAADVFGLAATVCVARAGMLPWSDPVSWADAAGLPSGGSLPEWVEVIRAALSANPDERPTAEEFAAGIRSGDEPADAPGLAARVDLRGLIPREVRRLAACSVDAMVDGGTVVVAQAVPPAASDTPPNQPPPDQPPSQPTPIQPRPSQRSGVDPAPADAEETGFGHPTLSRPAVAAIAATATALLLGTGAYAWAQHDPPRAAAAAVATPAPSYPSAPAALPTPSAPPPPTRAQLLTGASRVAGQFLQDVGARRPTACRQTVAAAVITTPGRSRTPITCDRLIQHAGSLLSARALTAMSRATVSMAYTRGTGATDSLNQPYPQTYVSIDQVPSLRRSLGTLFVVLTYRDGQWQIVRADLGSGRG